VTVIGNLIVRDVGFCMSQYVDVCSQMLTSEVFPISGKKVLNFPVIQGWMLESHLMVMLSVLKNVTLCMVGPRTCTINSSVMHDHNILTLRYQEIPS
jgi:hypothetical protein